MNLSGLYDWMIDIALSANMVVYVEKCLSCKSELFVLGKDGSPWTLESLKSSSDEGKVLLVKFDEIPICLDTEL